MGRTVDRYTVNTVIAYGVRRNITLILKQPIMHQEMIMAGSKSTNTGLSDLLFSTKYGIYRRNTPQYTLGISAILGLEFPTGMNVFSKDTWNMHPGVYVSWRSGNWGSDFNIAYAWNGFADKGRGGMNPGHQVSLDVSLAHQFSFGAKARKTVAPVLEVSYKHIFADRLQGQTVANTGESVLYISPGVKVTLSSLILELLVQIPAWQDQEGTQLKRSIAPMVGLRYMF